MNWRQAIVSGVLCAGFLTLGTGCWHSQMQTDITPPDESTTPASFVPTPAEQVKDMDQRLAKFDARAFELPGNGEVAYRALMEDTFEDQIALLPQLEGADPDGIFRQQLHQIDSYRQQLIGLSWDVSAESIVASGVRAGYTGLEAIYTRNFADNADIGTSMNDLGSKVDALDTAHGDDAKADVAKAEQASSAIMRQMNTVLETRAATAATMPSTEPATEMSPATAPDAAPSTAPMQ
jgi:hypothetical protein